MNYRFISLLSSLILTSAAPTFSQYIIKGQVMDPALNESIIGADVHVINRLNNDTLTISTTDEDGYFDVETKINQLKIAITTPGFSTLIIDSLVLNTALTQLNQLFLETAPMEEYGEVVIQSTRDYSSINTLYNLQKLNPVMSNGISADIIQRSPDRNTGEVLKRMSGASIQDNKFVIIRGMSERYNMSTLDGGILPSTEMNKKAFSFDLIPSYAVDQVVIYKSGKADLPSEFAGGLIHIVTKSIPNSAFTQINIGSQYNTVSTGKDFKTQKHTTSDFLSFGKNDRTLPSSFLNYQDMTNVKKYHPNNIHKNIPIIESLNHDYGHGVRKALPGMNVQFSHGNRHVTNNGKTLGYIAGLTLSHDESIRPDVIRHYDNYSYRDNIYQYKSAVSAIFNAGLQTEKNTLTWSNIFYNSFEDSYLEREGTNWGNSSQIQYHAFDLQQKLFLKTGLNWKHESADSGWVMEAKISSAYVNNHQPDQKKINYTRNLGQEADPFTASLNTVGKYNNRLFSQVKEITNTATVDFTLPKTFLKNTSFKTGVSEVMRHRDLSNRYLGMVINDGVEVDQNILNSSKDDLFSLENIRNGSFKLVDQSSDGDFYTAQTYNTSAYGMLDYNHKKNRIVAGVRLEHYALNFNSTYNADDFKMSWFSVLPSINWNYNINEKMISRLGYYTSTIRPEIREIAPIGYYDYELNAMITGNPFLKPTTIHNFDYKWELYPSSTELISAGVFYKYFKNTIENRVYTSNSSYDITPQNFNTAHNMGVEVEMRKNLGHLFKTTALDPLTAYVNATYTYSRTELPDNFYILGEKQTHRALSGQSPWMVNAGVYYTHPENKYTATLLYNYIDKSIYMLGHDRIGHVYLNSRHVMDFQLSFEPVKNLTVKFNVKDLFNSPLTFFIDQNSNGKLDNASRDISQQIDIYKDWIWQEYRPGSTFGLSIQYKIK